MRLVADNFGLKIGIEGEKEFKKALSEINQSFKVLGSEMKLVSSQFDANDKSIQALSARNTVLNKEIDAQRQKIETLRAALQNASESFGDNDRRTQTWQLQLNTADAALNGMERELTANERAMESLSQQETEAADATERLSQEISRQEDELAGMKRAYSNAVLEYGKGSSEAKGLEGRVSQRSGDRRESRERLTDAAESRSLAAPSGTWTKPPRNTGWPRASSPPPLKRRDTAGTQRRNPIQNFIKSWAIRIPPPKPPSFWRSLPKTSRTLPSGRISRPASTAPSAMHSPSRA